MTQNLPGYKRFLYSREKYCSNLRGCNIAGWPGIDIHHVNLEKLKIQNYNELHQSLFGSRQESMVTVRTQHEK